MAYPAMNYRHGFHAGNFADVVKHALVVALLTALQRKAKGLLYLDTHAGRGRYDLERAAAGETLARRPEWPDGIGRLTETAGAPPAVLEYLAQVRRFDREAGNLADTPRFYPGSPLLVQALLRPQDRMALCEMQPAECAALRAELGAAARVSVQALDGYVALRAMLPPPERRALVLIDPPFEAQDEYERIAEGLREGLRRFSSGTFAVWYPLTDRARVGEFATRVRNLAPPPTLFAELEIAPESSTVKMHGCGLLIVNPPWGFAAEARTLLEFLAPRLAREGTGRARVDWVVPER
jgi:23S rRNA (adenine2030-N6)-methyltransferase